jgi:SAM-dependent methyltransferase
LSRARERSGNTNFQHGTAKRLDFAPDFFDLIFSVDVIHHLDDHLKHFREAYQVLRPGGRICTVTDSAWIIRHRQPLAIYFPESVKVDLDRYPRVADLREAMEEVGFSDLSETTVEFPYRITDIQAYRDKAFSSLHLIPEEAFQRGIERMEEDLRIGPIPGVSRYLLLWGTR